MDAKEGSAAQDFNAPVVEVERIMGCDCFGFEGRLMKRRLGFMDRLVVKAISDREVGQGGDAGRRRWGSRRPRTPP